jgi:hypothetical protein
MGNLDQQEMHDHGVITDVSFIRHMPRDIGRAASVKRPKIARYRSMTVAWHASIDPRFDPVAALTELANSMGLVIKDRVGKGRVILRIDTPESSPEGRKASNILVKRAVAQLLLAAKSDPKLAAALSRLAERHKNGEDVTREIATAIERQVPEKRTQAGSTRPSAS